MVSWSLMVSHGGEVLPENYYAGLLVDAWDRDDGRVGLSSMVDVTLGEDPDGLRSMICP